MERHLGRVDLCEAICNRRGEVSSPTEQYGLGNPTPTKNHVSVHALNCLVTMKCEHHLVPLLLVDLINQRFTVHVVMQIFNEQLHRTLANVL